MLSLHLATIGGAWQRQEMRQPDKMGSIGCRNVVVLKRSALLDAVKHYVRVLLATDTYRKRAQYVVSTALLGGNSFM